MGDRINEVTRQGENGWKRLPNEGRPPIPLRFHFAGPCPFPLCTQTAAHSHRNLHGPATGAELLQALTASIADTQAQRTDHPGPTAYQDLDPCDRREFFYWRYIGHPNIKKGIRAR